MEDNGVYKLTLSNLGTLGHSPLDKVYLDVESYTSLRWIKEEHHLLSSLKDVQYLEIDPNEFKLLKTDYEQKELVLILCYRLPKLQLLNDDVKIVHEKRSKQRSISNFVSSVIDTLLRDENFIWTDDTKHLLGPEVKNAVNAHFSDKYERDFGYWCFAEWENSGLRGEISAKRSKPEPPKMGLFINYCCSSFHTCGRKSISIEKSMALLNISEASAPLFIFGGGKKRVKNAHVIEQSNADNNEEINEDLPAEKKNTNREKQKSISAKGTTKASPWKEREKNLNNSNSNSNNNNISIDKKPRKSNPQKLLPRSMVNLDLNDDLNLDTIISRFAGLSWLDMVTEVVTLTGTVYAERLFAENSEQNLVLIQWTPFGLAEDEWILAKDFTGKKKVSIELLSQQAKKNIFQCCLKNS